MGEQHSSSKKMGTMNNMKLIVIFSLNLAIVLADTQNTYRPFRLNPRTSLSQKGALTTAPVIAAGSAQPSPQHLAIHSGHDVLPGQGDSLIPRGIVAPSPGAQQGAALAAEGHALVAAQAAGFDAGLAAAAAISTSPKLIAPPQGDVVAPVPVPAVVASPKVKAVPGILSASPNSASPPLPIPHEITPALAVAPIEETPVIVASPIRDNIITDEAIVIA